MSETGPNTTQHVDVDALLAPLGPAHASRAKVLLDFLRAMPAVRGLFVGGSLTRKNADALSDLDCFCVVPNASGSHAVGEDLRSFARSAGADVVADHGRRYPWFGRLTTLYWTEPDIFGADVGCVEEHALPGFFVEPDSVVLVDYGRGEVSLRCDVVRAGLARRHEEMLERALLDSFAALVKLRKSLLRGHLWNAFELVSQLRRAYVLFLRDEHRLGLENALLGRPERDVEDFWDASLVGQLAQSIPVYHARSLAEKASTLTRDLLELDAARRVLARHYLPIARALEALEREADGLVASA